MADITFLEGLQTIGGSAISGGGAGAAVGSIIPGVGNVAGGVGGAAIGAGLGIVDLLNQREQIEAARLRDEELEDELSGVNNRRSIAQAVNAGTASRSSSARADAASAGARAGLSSGGIAGLERQVLGDIDRNASEAIASSGPAAIQADLIERQAILSETTERQDLFDLATAGDSGINEALGALGGVAANFAAVKNRDNPDEVEAPPVSGELEIGAERAEADLALRLGGSEPNLSYLNNDGTVRGLGERFTDSNNIELAAGIFGDLTFEGLDPQTLTDSEINQLAAQLNGAF